MKCPECDSEIPDDAVYCCDCGDKISHDGLMPFMAGHVVKMSHRKGNDKPRD